ncbi:unnamed protein product, partial [Medioppia subpectinata]
WVGATAEQGFPVIDQNGATEYGTGVLQFNIHNGVRQSVATSYLEQSNICPKLDIIAGAFVTKVLISGHQSTHPTAYGVEFVKNNKKYVVKANKEVIVSGGTYSSPQILMLSGVGPRDELQRLGIGPVWADLPVGQYIQNHVGIVIPMIIKNTTYVLPAPDPNVEQLYDVTTNKAGPLLVLPITFLNMNSSVNTNWEYPDLTISSQVINRGGLSYTNIAPMGVRVDEWAKYFQDILNVDSLDVLPILTRPKSVGQIRLRSVNPMDLPIIENNYFAHPDDIQAILDGISYAYYLAEETSASKLIDINPQPIPGCQYCPTGPKWRCVSYHRCVIQQRALSFHHTTGSCRMGGA